MNEQEFDRMLTKYADVVVKVGLNLRKGQRLSVRAIIDDAPFIRKVAESAYKAGARYVDVLWTDERISRIRFEHADPETITDIPEWMTPQFEEYRARGDADLVILSSDPDLFDGIDPELIAKSRTARAKKFEPLRKYENSSNWCIVATASPAWARKVFPGISTEEAQAKLWDAIFNSCRIDLPDPVQAWREHTDKLIKYKNYLSAKHYTELHYKGPGTDLIVGLPEKAYLDGRRRIFQEWDYLHSQYSHRRSFHFTPQRQGQRDGDHHQAFESAGRVDRRFQFDLREWTCGESHCQERRGRSTETDRNRRECLPFG